MVAAQISAAPVAAAVGAAGIGLGIGVLAGDDIKRLAQQAGDTQFGTQTAGTLGAFFQDAQTDIQKQVQAGMQAQREVVVVAGLQAQGALARAKVAYRDSVNLKVERLGDPERKFIAEMESVIADLKSTVDATLKQAGDRAQLMAARIRVTTDTPLLKSSGPLFLFPGLPYQTITLRGSFPAADGGAGVPELAFNGKSYKAFDVQSDTLRFSIPTAAFDAAEPTQIVWKSAELTVPWNTPVWNITTTTEFAKFSVLMGVLPHSFGRMVVEHKVARVRQEERTVQSGSFKTRLAATAGGEEHCLALAPADVAAGWRIRPGTGTFVADKPQVAELLSRWKDTKLRSESDQSVCWRSPASGAGSGEEASGGAGDGIDWRLSATIWREVSESELATENIDLAWGGKQFFKYGAGTWKLRFTRTGSGPKEVAATDLSQPLIRVNADATTVAVSVYPF